MDWTPAAPYVREALLHELLDLPRILVHVADRVSRKPMQRYHMALHVILGVRRSEIASRALEHRLADMALTNMTGQLGAVNVFLAQNAELERVRIGPLLILVRCVVVASCGHAVRYWLWLLPEVKTVLLLGKKMREL